MILTKSLNSAIPAFDEKLNGLSFVDKSAASAEYSRSIKSAVRGLWSGKLDVPGFALSMVAIVDRGLTRAWYAGAKECGIIAPGELSLDEIAAMRSAITQESAYIFNFAADILTGSQANGGKLSPLIARADLWANRYADVVNRAKIMACADQKLEWLLGPTKEHCVDCARLHGKVKRASQWQLSGWRPQSYSLTCRGFNCQCSLTVTTKPMSKGPLPRM